MRFPPTLPLRNTSNAALIPSKPPCASTISGNANNPPFSNPSNHPIIRSPTAGDEWNSLMGTVW